MNPLVSAAERSDPVRRLGLPSLPLVPFLLAACLSVASLEAEPPSPIQPARVRHLGLEDGLSHPAVYAVFQDHNGLLWVGTEEGLDRYDGYRLGPMNDDVGRAAPPVLRDVSVLSEDERGRMWIGTWGSGLYRYDATDGETVHFRHLESEPGSLSDDRVQALFPAADGSLWIGTYSGLNRLDPESGEILRYLAREEGSPDARAERIWALAPAPDGRIWVGTERGLVLFDPATGKRERSLRHTDSPDSPSSDLVRALFAGSDGTLWIGTEEGLDRRSHDGHYERLLGGAGDPPRGPVNVLLETPGGTLWVGSSHYGLWKLSEEELRLLPFEALPRTPARTPPQDIRSLWLDRSSMLWVGTRGGGLYAVDLKPAKFSLLSADPANRGSLTHPLVWSILADRDGGLWVGTHRGLDRFASDGKRIAHYDADASDPKALPHPSIQTLLEDDSGRVWVGTYDGLATWEEGEEGFTTYRAGESPLAPVDDRIQALLQDRQGAIWVATRGGLDRLEPGGTRAEHFGHDPTDPDSLGDDFLWTLLEDREGRLWIGTDVDGLARLDDGVFRPLRHDPDDPTSLSNDRVFSLLEDAQGRIWVGTALGLNLFRPETGSFRRFGLEHGLPSSTVAALQEGSDGGIWVATTRGLARFDPSTLAFRSYTPSDGLQGWVFGRGAAHGRDETLYFGGRNGITYFRPGELFDNPVPPPVVLTSYGVSYSSDVQPSNAGGRKVFELSYRDRTLSFEFAALDFTDPDRNLYAYWLEGNEAGWRDAGHERTTIYSNVPPGSYRLHVRAANSDGVWNREGLTVELRIAPPFWMTWWFQALIGLTVVGLLWGTHRARVSVVERQNRVLEETVALRTRELRESETVLRRQKGQLEQLDRIVGFINSETEFDELSRSVLEGVIFSEGAQRGFILLPDPDSKRFALRAHCGWIDGAPNVPPGVESEIEERYLSPLPDISTDIHAGRCSEGGEELARLVFRVRSPEQLEGYLVFEDPHDPTTFDRPDVLHLETLRGHVVSALVKGRTLELLRLLDERKNEFLGIAAHDLRSPLGGIVGHVDLLLRQLDRDRLEPDLLGRFLRNIRKAAEQMRVLIGDLLDIAAIESGTISLHLARQSIRDLIEETIGLHRPEAERKEIELRLDPSGPSPVLTADSNRLREVIDNLVGNALKFTHPGGKVTLSLEQLADEAVVHVRDTGQGLSREEIPEVFRRFTRLSPRPTGGETSTGLGLAIVKKVVEIHGGRAWVESVPGEGSTFSFSLPLDP